MQSSQSPIGHTTLYGDAITDVLDYITRLDLGDIESLQSRSRSERKEDVLSDEELALLLFVDEAEGLLNITKEHRSEGPTEAWSMLQELLEREEDARYDHEVALAIAEDRPIPPRPERRFRVSEAHFVVDEPPEEPESDSDSSSIAASDDDGYAPSLSGSSITDESYKGETSSFTIAHKTTEDEEPPCTICGDNISGIVLQAPCGHFFDTGCMEMMFMKASKDESLYPPRCCLTSIPPASVRQHLGAFIMMDFDKRALEFDTHAGSRVYCHVPQCSDFLGASTSTPSPLRCTGCHALTCSACKRSGHGSRACSDNAEEDERELSAMAADLHQTNGWTRCYSCHHLVEKSEGCYHITCTCKAQFCYLCGTPWKECDCPQFEIPFELRD